MADKKISQLTAATTPLAGTEVLPIVQSGTTVKVPVSDLTGGLSTIPVTKGGTGTSTSFTAGSVVFAGASGVYSQNNTKLFWDNTNNYLGINTNTPGYSFHVEGTSYFNAIKSNSALVNPNFLGSGGYWAVRTSTANDFCLDRYYGGSYNSLVVKNDTGSLLIAAGGLAVGSTTEPGATNLIVAGLTATYYKRSYVSADNTWYTLGAVGSDQLWRIMITDSNSSASWKMAKDLYMDASGNASFQTIYDVNPGYATRELRVNSGNLEFRTTGAGGNTLNTVTAMRVA